ncbi:MAG: hypothetical protein CMI09_06620 [Oceanospirillaceae bacterium]|nr:hypothetical protein [Oceanospirillaceae bacterium]
MLSLGMALRYQVEQWKIAHVAVAGQYTMIEPELIAGALLPVRGTSFFRVNVHDIRQIVKALPMVDRVSVAKLWPDTLEVVVTEKVPVARWNSDQLLTADGSISGRPSGFSGSGLPQFSGQPEWREELVRAYRQAQKVLVRHDLSIVSLTMNSVQSLEATLSNGWQIRFGRQFFGDRLVRLEKLLAHLTDKNVQYIDLRYGKGAAIRWSETGEHS